MIKIIHLKLEQLVLDNLENNNLTNDWLAKELSVSTRNLYRLLQQLTGQSPNHYIRNIRLAKAYEVLQSKKYATIKEVAASVGFRKTAYFRSLFKEKFECSPSGV